MVLMRSDRDRSAAVLFCRLKVAHCNRDERPPAADARNQRAGTIRFAFRAGMEFMIRSCFAGRSAVTRRYTVAASRFASTACHGQDTDNKVTLVGS